MTFRTPLFAVPFGLAALQGWHTHKRLPERMATHFDFAGNANGWMSRPAFFAFYFVLLGFMAATFLGIPALIRKLPVGLINLPNRHHWLAPERREETIADLAGRVRGLGLVTLLFIVAVMQLVLTANLGDGRLPARPMWTGLALIVAVTVGWTIALFRHYRLPP